MTFISFLYFLLFFVFLLRFFFVFVFLFFSFSFLPGSFSLLLFRIFSTRNRSIVADHNSVRHAQKRGNRIRQIESLSAKINCKVAIAKFVINFLFSFSLLSTENENSNEIRSPLFPGKQPIRALCVATKPIDPAAAAAAAAAAINFRTSSNGK